MVIHAHPDDESLFTGHIIATALASGAEVKLVTLTRGERGSSQNPLLRTISRNPNEMAAHRSNALRSALQAFPGLEHSFFGTRSYLETDPDSVGLGRIFSPDPHYNMTLVGGGKRIVADELVKVLKNFRPDSVVTLSSKNLNPDHKMAFKATRLAIKSLSASKPPKHFVVGEPGTQSAIKVGNDDSAKAKRKAISAYGDFVKLTPDTYDYGTGELKFSEPETLRLVG